MEFRIDSAQRLPAADSVVLIIGSASGKPGAFVHALLFPTQVQGVMKFPIEELEVLRARRRCTLCSTTNNGVVELVKPMVHAVTEQFKGQSSRLDHWLFGRGISPSEQQEYERPCEAMGDYHGSYFIWIALSKAKMRRSSNRSNLTASWRASTVT